MLFSSPNVLAVWQCIFSSSAMIESSCCYDCIFFAMYCNGLDTAYSFYHRCQDSSMVRFLRIDPIVSGLSPTSAKLSLRMR